MVHILQPAHAVLYQPALDLEALRWSRLQVALSLEMLGPLPQVASPEVATSLTW